jgi:hypothetical protein
MATLRKGSINDIHPEVGIIFLPKREEYIYSTLKNMNIDITMPQPAILGKNLDRDVLIKEGIVHPDCKLKINEIACSISHLTLIEKFYTQSLNKSIMIFEDDIQYDNTYYDKIKNLKIPDDTDITQYGHCWNICSTKEKVNETNVYITEHPLCAHSYAVSKKGAKKILENCYPILLPIDVFYVSISNNNGTISNTISRYVYNYKNPQIKEPLVIYTVFPRVFNQLKGTTDSKILLDIHTSNLGNEDACLECFEDLPYQYDTLIYILILVVITMGIWFKYKQ